jgi:hypothetical protein
MERRTAVMLELKTCSCSRFTYGDLMSTKTEERSKTASAQYL